MGCANVRPPPADTISDSEDEMVERLRERYDDYMKLSFAAAVGASDTASPRESGGARSDSNAKDSRHVGSSDWIGEPNNHTEHMQRAACLRKQSSLNSDTGAALLRRHSTLRSDRPAVTRRQSSLSSFGSASSMRTRSSLSSKSSVKTIQSQTSSGSCKSADADQTLIVFDWDDAICPSSWAREYCLSGEYNGPKPSWHPELRKFALEMIHMLSKAQLLGKVFILTTEQRPWVDLSCDLLMPQAAAILQGIPVIYAMDHMTDAEIPSYSESALRAEAKIRAVQAAVLGFYSPSEGKTWKNVVTIGCEPHGHDAIWSLVRGRPSSTRTVAGCRTKTIKLSPSPDLLQMRLQVYIVKRWLSNVVSTDDDLEVDVGEHANEKIAL